MIHSSMIIFKFIKTKSQIIVSSLNAKNVHQSPKRHSKLLSLIFTLNCLSKTSVIRIFGIRTKNMKFDQHYERGLLSYYPHHHHYLGIISPSPDEWQKKPKYILMEKYYGIKIDNQKNWCQICNKLPDTQVKSWGGGGPICAPCCWIGEVTSAWNEEFLQNHNNFNIVLFQC